MGIRSTGRTVSKWNIKARKESVIHLYREQYSSMQVSRRAIYRKYKLRLQSHILTAVLKLKIPAKIFESYILPAAISPPLLLYQKFFDNATTPYKIRVQHKQLAKPITASSNLHVIGIMSVHLLFKLWLYFTIIRSTAANDIFLLRIYTDKGIPAI